MKTIHATTLAALLLLGSQMAHAETLTLSAGTWQLGGTATFNVARNFPPDTVPTQKGEVGMTLSLAPQAGYFLMDNIELIVGVGLQLELGKLNEELPDKGGFNAGARAFFPLDAPVIPFVGLLAGMNFSKPELGDTTQTLVITVPAGVLYALNASVAIEAGFRVTYQHWLDEYGGAYLYIPVGYLGVQAFF